MTAVLKGAASILVHTPDLVPLGSKPTREIPRFEGLGEQCLAHLRSYQGAVAYPPNQVFIGNIRPDELAEMKQPWWRNLIADASREGPYGEIMPQDEFYGLLKAADAFDLVWLEEDFRSQIATKLHLHPLLGDLKGLEGRRTIAEIKEKLTRKEALPLNLDGDLVGCVCGAHEEDDALRAEAILEGLVTKASAFLALRHLLGKISHTNPTDIDYLFSFSEEAVGDRYQRGGGNLVRATAQMAGCLNASGVDVKGFCCGASHSLVSAAALIEAGIFEQVALVGGGSLAKLGMNFQPHIEKGMPILEDVLGAMAILVSRDDGKSPLIRTDAIGMHRICAASSAQEIYKEVVVKPLTKLKKKIMDIDRYAVELHNPEITIPARRGNPPLINYRALGALASLRGEIAREGIDDFVKRHGMPGFSPTQGHIPEAIPFMGHARDMIMAREIENVMFIAKGSVFLARMTNLSDAVSFILERNPQS
ncbi:MAG: Glycine/sarcosine/betaine reductase complex component C subunit beta [Chloroflexi bacterium]|nr:Glycine/sarcosine/betaine reductase complex component C subunit beta [Chloroflexota bacterium]